MPRKETRYGAQGYVRRKVKNPLTGEYQAVYGRTIAEREEKIRLLEESWAREIRRTETPYFWEYAGDWFARQAGEYSAQRRADVAREINKVICPVIGGKLLSEITSDDVADVMATRSGLSRSARSKTLQILRRICRAAVRAGKLAQDPTADVKAGGKKTPPQIALTPEQQTALLSAVEGLPVEPFCRLALYTGMRTEEICGLQWRCVHLDPPAHVDVRRACKWPSRSQAAPEDLLKSQAAWRTIPIPPPLLGALTAARARLADLPEEKIRERYVVTSGDGSPWSYTAKRRAWDAVTARSTGTVQRRRKDPKTGERIRVDVVKHLGDRIPKHPGVVVSLDFETTPHNLRRTYITRLILGGVDLKRVQYLAGHESPEITLAIYTSLMGHRPEDLIDDVSAIFPG